MQEKCLVAILASTALIILITLMADLFCSPFKGGVNGLHSNEVGRVQSLNLNVRDDFITLR